MTSGPCPGGASTAGGDLKLAFVARGGRTVATTVAHRGALRTLRPHYADDSGWPTWTTLNPGGGYLAGDSYRLTVDLAAGARATLIGQSATKVYRCTDGTEVTQHAALRLGPGAVLDWRGEPLIAYAGARFRQRTAITRDPGATVVLSDVVTAGWSPDRTPFSWSRVHLLTEIRRSDGTLEFLDNLLLDPGHDDPADAALGAGFSHVGSLVVLDARVDSTVVAEVDALLIEAGHDTHARFGLGLIPGPGLVLRVLADSSEGARTIVDTVADDLLARWFRRPPLERHQW